MTRIHLETDGPLARLRMDDGKANAIQLEWCAEMNERLDHIEAEASLRAVILLGRDRFFSGGLDLKILPQLDPEGLRQCTEAFAATMRRVFLFSRPVVAASAGHAIAGGMMLFLAADLRLAVDETRSHYGLNEAANGIPFLSGTAGLCQASIPPAHHTELILHGQMLDATGLRERGIARELCDDTRTLEACAVRHAEALLDLEPAAYAINKRMLRQRAWDEASRLADTMRNQTPTQNVFAHLGR